MSGKGSAQRPTDKEAFDQSFDRIFGITCKRRGKTGLQPGSIHTCTPKNQCDCNMRTKLVGDGCEVCNYDYAKDHQ